MEFLDRNQRNILHYQVDLKSSIARIQFVYLRRIPRGR